MIQNFNWIHVIWIFEWVAGLRSVLGREFALLFWVLGLKGIAITGFDRGLYSLEYLKFHECPAWGTSFFAFSLFGAQVPIKYLIGIFSGFFFPIFGEESGKNAASEKTIGKKGRKKGRDEKRKRGSKNGENAHENP